MPWIEAVPELSVVVPLYDREEQVVPLFREICAALDPTGRPYEVVLVDDGSGDGTAAALEALALEDPRACPVFLDGCFGEAAALCAGFESARGRILLTLDGDLRDDPRDLPRLLNRLEERGTHAAVGTRRAESVRSLAAGAAEALEGRVVGAPARAGGPMVLVKEVARGVYLPQGLHRYMPAVLGVRERDLVRLRVTRRPAPHSGRRRPRPRSLPAACDLLALRSILRGPRRALAGVERLLLATGAAGGLALVLSLYRPDPGAAVALIGIALLAGGAACLRAGLGRWLLAQEFGTYRVRCDERPPARNGHRPSRAEARRRAST